MTLAEAIDRLGDTTQRIEHVEWVLRAVALEVTDPGTLAELRKATVVLGDVRSLIAALMPAPPRDRSSPTS